VYELICKESDKEVCFYLKEQINFEIEQNLN